MLASSPSETKGRKRVHSSSFILHLTLIRIIWYSGTHMVLNLKSGGHRCITKGDDDLKSKIRHNRDPSGRCPFWNSLFLEGVNERVLSARDQRSALFPTWVVWAIPWSKAVHNLIRKSGKKINLRDKSYLKGIFMIGIIKERGSSLANKLIKPLTACFKKKW